MRISVIGCSYLGAVTSACFAQLGHDVVGIDLDDRLIDALADGRAPFFEPGLPEVLEAATASGRLRYTTDPSAVRDCTVHVICVGTPQSPDGGAADLRQVDSAVAGLLPYLKPGDVVVGKSTVPVGTAERIAAQIAEVEPGATLGWNPEFLREGFAVQDTLHPDRLVYGVPNGPPGERPTAVLDEVFAQTLADGTPQVVTDYATAQLVKVAANAFLATKLSFINAMAELCDVTGADVTRLADAIGYDERIGRRYLNAGLGFGGGCLPKDIRAFMARAGELGADDALGFLREVDLINLGRRERFVEMTRKTCGGSVEGRRIAALGLAFKPDSDDVRDSPALDVAARLASDGAEVVATDPHAIVNARVRHPELGYVDSVDEAVRDADLVVVLTAWREYVELDPRALARLVAHPVVLDAMNALDRDAWRRAGWTYRGMGRS